MIDFKKYKADFYDEAIRQGYNASEISDMIAYAERLNGQDLPIIFDQLHLSLLVGYDYAYLLGAANSPMLYYRHYDIPKKSGGTRPIDEPLPSLKEIQSWILLNILYPAMPKHLSPVAKAFVPGKSLRENARFHRNKQTVVALDLKDSFGSIRFGEVYGFFTKLGYNSSVAMMLTRLCVFKGSLPQGAPTSPMLSNLVFQELDNKIFRYCRDRKIMYTRYADDMTFSADKMDVTHLISYVRMLIAPKRLKLNDDKTNVMGRGASQRVTGIVVNEKIQVPKAYRDKVRQEVYYCMKFGIANHMQHTHYPEWINTPEQYIHHLQGKINYVLQVNPKDEMFRKYASWLNS